MATIQDLETEGKLLAYDPDLEAYEFPTRWIHMAPSFPEWIETTLRTEIADDARNLTPFDQWEQIFYDYTIGRPLVYARDRRKLDPLTQHVWELKTPDVRLFGWLPKARHFIVVCGEMKRNLKPASKYGPYIGRVVEFRNTLNLDLPKFLQGIAPHEIC